MGKRGRGYLTIILFIVVLLIALAIGGFLFISGTLGRINRTSTSPANIVAASQETFDRSSINADTLAAEDVNFNSDNIKMMQDDDVKNILLIGQDRRPEEGDKSEQPAYRSKAAALSVFLICPFPCSSSPR